MRGLNVMYDFMRRPSMAFDPRVIAIQQMDAASAPVNESPMTPLPENLENYEIDDEFNLPISVAIIMLLTYMFFGASIHCMWENWSFFDAFYFVFISISTIGELMENSTQFIFQFEGFFLPPNRFWRFNSLNRLAYGHQHHLSCFRSRSHIHVHQCGTIEVKRSLQTCKLENYRFTNG